MLGDARCHGREMPPRYRCLLHLLAIVSAPRLGHRLYLQAQLRRWRRFLRERHEHAGRLPARGATTLFIRGFSIDGCIDDASFSISRHAVTLMLYFGRH